MGVFKSILHYLQAFSLDIALGGAAGALFVSMYLGVSLGLFTLLELILCIWLIYTFDHLIDVASRPGEPVTFRHRIIWRNKTTVWGIWSFLLIVAFSLLFRLPKVTIIYGGILACIVGVYFLTIRFLRSGKIYHKEITGALVYATGIFIGPLSIYEYSITWDIWVLFVELSSLAFLNLILFSIYERQVDYAESFQSLVLAIGQRSVTYLAYFVALCVIIIAVISIYIGFQNKQLIKAQTIVLIMDLLLVLVLFNRNYFALNQRYRLLGDLVFFIPILFIL